MSRLEHTILVDTSGCSPMFASMSSLAEAAAKAQADRGLDLLTTTEGLAFNGKLIARIETVIIEQFTARMKATPTFWMPAFVAEICILIPGIKVTWRAGWPYFSAADWDDGGEDVPTPLTPESLVPA